VATEVVEDMLEVAADLNPGSIAARQRPDLE